MVRLPDITVSGDKFVVILIRGDFNGASFLMSSIGVPPISVGVLSASGDMPFNWTDIGDVVTDVAVESDNCSCAVVDGVKTDDNGNDGISGLCLNFFLTEGVTIGSKLYFLYVAAASDDDEEEDEEEDDDDEYDDDDDDIDEAVNGDIPTSLFLFPLLPGRWGVPIIIDLALFIPPSVGIFLLRVDLLCAYGDLCVLFALG